MWNNHQKSVTVLRVLLFLHFLLCGKGREVGFGFPTFLETVEACGDWRLGIIAFGCEDVAEEGVFVGDERGFEGLLGVFVVFEGDGCHFGRKTCLVFGLV